MNDIVLIFYLLYILFQLTRDEIVNVNNVITIPTKAKQMIIAINVNGDMAVKAVEISLLRIFHLWENE